MADKLVEDVARAIAGTATGTDYEPRGRVGYLEAQAAIRVCMEAAAKVAEKHNQSLAWPMTSAKIAREIRALAKQDDKP